MSASQHIDPTTSSIPSPRGLVWPSSGGSKHENVGGTLWALARLQMLSPKAAIVAMSERIVRGVGGVEMEVEVDFGSEDAVAERE